MYDCPVCDRSFGTWRAREQHIDATGHDPRYDCETCYRDFPNLHAVRQHMDALGHWARTFPCETCDDEFRSEADADRHMERHGHYRNYCKACDQHFMNENNLRMVSVEIG